MGQCSRRTGVKQGRAPGAMQGRTKRREKLAQRCKAARKYRASWKKRLVRKHRAAQNMAVQKLVLEQELRAE